ncbi:hypothetical protein TD95_005284, partial [Thielaviopsis punctulata]
ASKFLAQSQLTASNFANPTQNEAGPSSRQNHDASRIKSQPSVKNRSYLPPYRPGNPYQQTGGNTGSCFGPLAFGSHLAQPQEAPLFHSHYDDFREEDDEGDDDDDDRGREAADLYALQRSRRVAAASKLAESMGSEGDGSNPSLDHSRGGRSSFVDDYGEDGDEEDDDQDSSHNEDGQYGDFRSRKPGWWSSLPDNQRSRQGALRFNKPSKPFSGNKHMTDEESESLIASNIAGSSRGRMVDITLDSQVVDNDPPASMLGEELQDSSPVPFQKFSDTDSEHHGHTPSNGYSHHSAAYRPHNTAFGESEIEESRVQDAVVMTAPMDSNLFKHDSFFAWLYLIMIASILSTFFLVWLHTSPPDSSHPIGDSIYNSLESSMYMLAVDTVVAIMVALVWLAALQSFVRPMVVLIVVAMPLICVSFFMYPFVASFKARGGMQEKAMRWASSVPLAAAGVWVYCVYKGRNSIRQAIQILEFSARILHMNSALVMVGLCSLGAIVVWTWLWLSMFTRIFLDGYMSVAKAQWVINSSTWWLGAWFVFIYMWTVSVINEVHRATSAATVSQWYFHRNAVPVTPSQEVVKAAVNHAVTTIFGTICESTLLARLVRLPILLLPARMSIMVQRIANLVMPTSVVSLTNPLTLTYAGIHSQNLAMSARGLSSMEFLGPQTPTATLTPRVFNMRSDDPRATGLVPYRLAKLLLHATRFVMAIAMGFAGWVVTSRQLSINRPDGSGTYRGSLYAYVVGLVASFIGYSVMGAMESILGNIVDAVVVCYGSERRMQNGVGTYCMEAAYLFGGRRRAGEEDY